MGLGDATTYSRWTTSAKRVSGGDRVEVVLRAGDGIHSRVRASHGSRGVGGVPLRRA